MVGRVFLVWWEVSQLGFFWDRVEVMMMMMMVLISMCVEFFPYLEGGFEASAAWLVHSFC